MARKSEYKKAYDVDYNPMSLMHNLTPKQIQQEYSRLRKLTLRRMERLERSDFSKSTPALVGKSISRKLKPSGQLGERAMANRIAEMTHFLDMKGSTIKGARDIRRETRSILEEQLGYKFRNFEEFRLFGQFMDYLRGVYKDTLHYLDSDITNLFKEHAKEVLDNSMSFDEFINTYQNQYKTTPTVLKRPS